MGDPASTRFSVDVRTGRLVEARIFALTTVEGIAEYSAALVRACDGLPAGAQGILCADHRPALPYPQPVTDALVELFTRMNTRLERVAIVTGGGQATLYMQLRRIVREAMYETRQVFQSTLDAERHLALSLTLAEQQRAREFLAEI